MLRSSGKAHRRYLLVLTLLGGIALAVAVVSLLMRNDRNADSSSKLKVTTYNYIPTPSDPKPEEAASIARTFFTAAGIKIGEDATMGLGSRLSKEFEKRPVWTVGVSTVPGFGFGVAIDMQTRKVVAFGDSQRGEWELRGSEAKRHPAVAEKDAQEYAEALAHRLGVPEGLKFAVFDCSHMGGNPRGSLVCGGPFKNRAGELIAHIRVDLFDGGLHGFEFHPWKLQQNESGMAK